MTSEKLFFYNERKANSSSIWILFLFLGWSYGSLDKMGLQILFYLTFGGFGIWAFIRLFTLNSSIKKHNRLIAKKVGLTRDEMIFLDLI